MNFIIFLIFSSRKLVNSRNNFCITQLSKLPSYIFPFWACLLAILLHIALLRKKKNIISLSITTQLFTMVVDIKFRMRDIYKLQHSVIWLRKSYIVPLKDQWIRRIFIISQRLSLCNIFIVITRKSRFLLQGCDTSYYRSYSVLNLSFFKLKSSNQFEIY